MKTAHKKRSTRSPEEQEYYALMRKVFRALAPWYDLIAMPISSVRKRVVKVTEAQKGSDILDIGTGTGKQAFAFAKEGHTVTGIDLSEDMLRIARKNNTYPRVTLKVADGTQLPFPENSFDVACISLVLHEMPASIRRRALKEMVRVTKPGGKIVVVDYGLPDGRMRRFLIYHFIRLFERGYYAEFVKSDVESLLRKSGAEVTAVHSILSGAGKIMNAVKRAKRAREANA